MADSHLAQLYIAQPAQIPDDLPVLSPEFEESYVASFKELKSPTERQVGVLIALIEQHPQLYAYFETLEATNAQRLLAATNYAKTAGCFPSTDQFVQCCQNPAIFPLLTALLQKSEQELQQNHRQLFELVHRLELRQDDCGAYLRQLARRAAFGADQLPPQLLDRLLPRRFEALANAELQRLVFAIYCSARPAEFDASSIVFGLFAAGNARSALQWSHFHCRPEIFRNIRLSAETLLFTSFKLESPQRTEYLRALERKHFKLIGQGKIEALYDRDFCTWRRTLTEQGGQIQAAELLLILQVAEMGTHFDVLPDFAQVQEFCSSCLVDTAYIARVKQLYVENGKLETAWHRQSFDVCFAALSNNLLGKSDASVLQIVYMAFVGRKFKYYILNEKQYIDFQLFNASRPYHSNPQIAVFLAQCSAQERVNYGKVNSLQYLIPVGADCSNLVLRLIYALNDLVGGSDDAFGGLFSELLQHCELAQVIGLSQRLRLKVALPSAFSPLPAQKRRLVLEVLQLYNQQLRRPELALLTQLFSQDARQQESLQLAQHCQKSLFHPRLLNQLQEGYEQLKQGQRDLVYPLQIAEFIGLKSEFYVLCSARLLILLLYTGMFEDALQLELAKLFLGFGESWAEFLSGALAPVSYDAGAPYARYFAAESCFTGHGAVLTRLAKIPDFGARLPFIGQKDLFVLIRQSVQQRMFTFNQPVILPTEFHEDNVIPELTEAQFIDFLEKTEYAYLGLFERRRFGLPSALAARLTCSGEKISRYSGIVRLRYELPAVYRQLSYQAEFAQLPQLLALEFDASRQRALAPLLDSQQGVVWKQLAEVRRVQDLDEVIRNPYRLMTKRQEAEKYAEIVALQKACGLAGVQNFAIDSE